MVTGTIAAPQPFPARTRHVLGAVPGAPRPAPRPVGWVHLGSTACLASAVPSSSRSATPRSPTCSAPDCGCSSSASTRGCGPRRQHPLRAPGQPLLPGPAGGRDPRAPHRPVGRDDRRRPRPPARPGHRHHQPRPPRHRPRRRADAATSCAGARRRSTHWSREHEPRGGRRRRDHGLPAGVRPARAVVGEQPDGLAGARLWVVPNPSGLNAHHTVATLAQAYAEPARAAGVLDRA